MTDIEITDDDRMNYFYGQYMVGQDRRSLLKSCLVAQGIFLFLSVAFTVFCTLFLSPEFVFAGIVAFVFNGIFYRLVRVSLNDQDVKVNDLRLKVSSYEQPE